MDIVFASAKLRKTMIDAKARQKEYGELAKTLGRRLDDLSALDSLAEAYAIGGQFEPLQGDRLGQYSLRLSPNWRLVLEPAVESLPKKDDGGIDLSKVTAARILAVEDYHRR